MILLIIKLKFKFNNYKKINFQFHFLTGDFLLIYGIYSPLSIYTDFVEINSVFYVFIILDD